MDYGLVWIVACTNFAWTGTFLDIAWHMFGWSPGHVPGPGKRRLSQPIENERLAADGGCLGDAQYWLAWIFVFSPIPWLK
jgi:hypothetical protein